MFTPGFWQMLIVAMVVLLLFGNRLPSVMRSLGQGITEFKKGISDNDSDANKRIEDQHE